MSTFAAIVQLAMSLLTEHVFSTAPTTSVILVRNLTSVVSAQTVPPSMATHQL